MKSVLSPAALIVLVILTVAACGSETPSQRFLDRDMYLRMNAQGQTRLLHMKPGDLYKLFDMNVDKHWEKNHENSWDMVLNMKNPNTGIKQNMQITLSVDPSLDGVVVDKIVVNAEEYNQGLIVQMIGQLDAGFQAQQSGR